MSSEEESYKKFFEQMAGSEKFHQTVLKELENLLEQQAKDQAKSIFESGLSLNEKLRLAEEKIQNLEQLLNEENIRAQQLVQDKEDAEEASSHALDGLNSELQDLQNKFESQQRNFDKRAYEWDLEKKKLVKTVSLAEKNMRNAQHNQQTIFDRRAYEWDLEKKKLIKTVSLAETNMRNAQHNSVEKEKELDELRKQMYWPPMESEKSSTSNEAWEALLGACYILIIFVTGFGAAWLFI